MSQLEPLLHCGNCRQPMQRLGLNGHYGRRVEIDLCAACHLLWFDTVESVRLTGASMLEVIGEMARLQPAPHHLLSTTGSCPRCLGPLKLINNRTRWGLTLQQECLRGHGVAQTFGQFLSEKGLVRKLGPADRERLRRGGVSLHCMNCGAGLDDAQAARCSYCGSVPGLIDIARLARALDPDGAMDFNPLQQQLQRTDARHHVFNCHACGAAQADTLALRCDSCAATLTASSLPQAHAIVKDMATALQQHQQRPAPHVRARKLDALNGDLERRRAWVRDIQSSASARYGDSDDELGARHWLARLLGDRFDPDKTRRWESVLAWLAFGLLTAWWLGAFRG